MSGSKLSVVDGSRTGVDWKSRSFSERMLELYDRVGYMQKGGTNAHFKYKFLQESELKGIVNQACRDLHILIGQLKVMPIGEATVKSAVVRVTVSFIDALAKEGDKGISSVSLQGIGGGVDASDKAPMKAVVAAFKYALMNGLSIRTGDDPEGANGEDVALAQLLEDIEGADSASRLNILKGEVGRWSDDGASFKKLKAAWTARHEALKGAEKE